jgi:hypothetical protein
VKGFVLGMSYSAFPLRFPQNAIVVVVGANANAGSGEKGIGNGHKKRAQSAYKRAPN